MSHTPEARAVSRELTLFTGGAFFALFLMGFVDNLKGPVLPALLSEFNFNYTRGGAIAMSAYLGFLVSSLFTGLLADLAGKKVPLLLGGGFFTLGILGFISLRGLIPLVVSMGIIGLGIGALDLGANIIIVDLRVSDRGRYLSLMSVFHGVASALSPALAGLMLAAGFGWRSIYLYSLPLALAMLLFALLARYPGSGSGGASALTGTAVRSLAGPPLTWLFIQAGCYMALEIGAASWLVEYSAKVKGVPLQTAAMFLSLMFVAAILGRLANSVLIDRAGYARMTVLYASAAFLCLSGGIFGPTGLVYLIPLAGMFYAPIFSTTIAMVSGLPRGNSGGALGLLMACAGLGGMLGPWLVGIAADRLGLQAGFAVLPLFCLGMLGCQWMVRRALRNPGS